MDSKMLGGGSNCGKFGVQLTVLAGFERIVVVGGNETELRSYGATHVMDRYGTPSETVSRIREIVGDDLLYAYDAVNPPATQIIRINALSSTRKGKVARLLPAAPIDESLVENKSARYELLDVLGSSRLGIKSHSTRPNGSILKSHSFKSCCSPSGYLGRLIQAPTKVHRRLKYLEASCRPELDPLGLLCFPLTSLPTRNSTVDPTRLTPPTSNTFLQRVAGTLEQKAYFPLSGKEGWTPSSIDTP
ncbi:predicted protein [Aspergillus terreus NIH2624]|uniref:Alcohol dehydrogenase-like C-terminal domain-containing protein n=1 Tax=Aspergillus terreus (strain NIH 2624 / FGSC A1156) TaxID=341663 RepID=Q0C8P6_ASPTN|nr:uncharacterized protein ATEG_09938 [Aspergillus terreus NIH2624]EAU30129.1 predicted protein [Aspergillus terreus NIH2624]